MGKSEHEACLSRSRAVSAAWGALALEERTPERAVVMIRAHGFTCGEPYVSRQEGDPRGSHWIVGSWETWGAHTYGHPCVTLHGWTEA